MDRRTIAGSSFLAILTSGFGALVGVTALEPKSEFITPLLYGGVVGVGIGCIGLLYLFIRRQKVQPPETIHPVFRIGDADDAEFTNINVKGRAPLFDIDTGKRMSVRNVRQDFGKGN